jgi:hypothetical protein
VKVEAGEQTRRYRRSTTELLELALQAGIEPATTRLPGEVTAPYATGHFLLLNQSNAQTPTPGNQRKESDRISASRCPLVRDYAPAPRSDRFRWGLLNPAPWQEVTLLFRHRRITY